MRSGQRKTWRYFCSGVTLLSTDKKWPDIHKASTNTESGPLSRRALYTALCFREREPQKRYVKKKKKVNYLLELAHGLAHSTATRYSTDASDDGLARVLCAVCLWWFYRVCLAVNKYFNEHYCWLTILVAAVHTT